MVDAVLRSVNGRKEKMSKFNLNIQEFIIRRNPKIKIIDKMLFGTATARLEI